MSDKPFTRLKTGALSRGLSVAKTSFRLGASSVRHALGKNENLNDLLQTQAKILSEELGKLKGTAMKVGQMLSLYGEHFLPPEVNAFLKTLQSQSSPIAWEQMHSVMVQELGAEKLLELDINPQPIASASVGQVYRARVKSTGQEIALKVQYPDVERAIESDLKTMKVFFAASAWIPQLPKLDAVFAEVQSMLRQEIDYQKEFAAIERYAEKAKKFSHYKIALPNARFSTGKVIATQYTVGLSIDDPEIQALSPERKNQLALSFLELYFHEVYEWRLVQTDPHFGNYKIKLRENETERDSWILFDFGATREISAHFSDAYRRMVGGALIESRDLVFEAATDLGFIRKDDPEEFKNHFFDFVTLVLEPFRNGLYHWGRSDLPKRVFKLGAELALSFQLRPPPQELVFLDRKLAGVFTTLSVLQAEIDARPLLEAYLLPRVATGQA